jgi:hypothetical protein
MALTMALSMWRRTGAIVTLVPSGVSTSFRPPRLRVETGADGDGSVIAGEIRLGHYPPFEIQGRWRGGP